MTPIIVRSFTPDTVISKAATDMAQQLTSALAQHDVLLLLSGGSAIPVYQQLFSQLTSASLVGHALTVSLFDERYVPAGSSDSNAQALQQAGVIDQIQGLSATWLPYLMSDEAGEVVARRMSDTFIQLLSNGAVLLIAAGVGDDGHTAGLLPSRDPNTVAQVFQNTDLVCFYELADEVVNPYRQRITATPALISRANEIMAFATGEKKVPALQRLMAGDESITTCPAISLRSSQNPLILFTDQVI